MHSDLKRRSVDAAQLAIKHLNWLVNIDALPVSKNMFQTGPMIIERLVILTTSAKEPLWKQEKEAHRIKRQQHMHTDICPRFRPMLAHVSDK